MTDKPCIFHIASTSDVEDMRENGEYKCPSLESEGFIHCCDKNQLAGVVSRYYQGVDDVVLLLLDVDKLEAALIRENTMGGSELFPHLYGPINGEAVIDTIPFGINSLERQGLSL